MILDLQASREELQGFQDYLRQLEPPRSPTTIARYSAVVRRWQREDHDPVDWLRATVTSQTARGTALCYRSAVKQWLKFKGHDLPKSLLPGVQIQKIQQTFRESLNAEELDQYIEIVRMSETPEPTKTILLLLPFTGLRIFEACSLAGDAMRPLGRGHVFRVVGKRNKVRMVPLNEPSLKILRAYRKSQKARLDESDFLFPSPQSTARHISKSTVQSHLLRLRTGLPGRLGRISAHWLRHTYAMTMLRKGARLPMLQNILGHDSLDTTGVYLRSSTEDLFDAADLWSE